MAYGQEEDIPDGEMESQLSTGLEEICKGSQAETGDEWNCHYLLLGGRRKARRTEETQGLAGSRQTAPHFPGGHPPAASCPWPRTQMTIPVLCYKKPQATLPASSTDLPAPGAYSATAGPAPFLCVLSQTPEQGNEFRLQTSFQKSPCLPDWHSLSTVLEIQTLHISPTTENSLTGVLPSGLRSQESASSHTSNLLESAQGQCSWHVWSMSIPNIT